MECLVDETLKFEKQLSRCVSFHFVTLREPWRPKDLKFWDDEVIVKPDPSVAKAPSG